MLHACLLTCLLILASNAYSSSQCTAAMGDMRWRSPWKAADYLETVKTWAQVRRGLTFRDARGHMLCEANLALNILEAMMWS